MTAILPAVRGGEGGEEGWEGPLQASAAAIHLTGCLRQLTEGTGAEPGRHQAPSSSDLSLGFIWQTC